MSRAPPSVLHPAPPPAACPQYGIPLAEFRRKEYDFSKVGPSGFPERNTLLVAGDVLTARFAPVRGTQGRQQVRGAAVWLLCGCAASGEGRRSRPLSVCPAPQKDCSVALDPKFGRAYVHDVHIGDGGTEGRVTLCRRAPPRVADKYAQAQGQKGINGFLFGPGRR